MVEAVQKRCLYIILAVSIALVINSIGSVTFDERIDLAGDGKMSGYTNSLMKEEFNAEGQQTYNRVLSEMSAEGNVELTYKSFYKLIGPSNDKEKLIKSLMDRYNSYPGKWYFNNRYKISSGSSFYSPSHELIVNNLTSLWARNEVKSTFQINPISIKTGQNVEDEFFGQVAISSFKTNYNLAGNGSLKERISDISIDNRKIDVAGLYANGSFKLNTSAYSEMKKAA